jgi:hypothetical protein
MYCINSNSNVVIGEGKMRAGQLNSGHVAGHAFLSPDLAGGSSLRGRAFSALRRMAGQALCVIRAGIVQEILMRIMTGQAGDPCIGRIVATAVFQAIRLESDIPHIANVRGKHVAC